MIVTRLGNSAASRMPSTIDYLTGLAENLSCTYVQAFDRLRGPVSQHSSSCEKRRLKRQANSLTTPVMNGPPPENDIPSNLAISEYRPPENFKGLRNITQLLSRRYSPEGTLKSRPPPEVVLQNYRPLWAYCPNKSPGITLASTTKSFLESHYSSTKVPCAESDVIKNHGPPMGIQCDVFLYEHLE